MLPDLSLLEHFHFMRPAWALILLPWLLVFVLRNRRDNQPDMFGGIIAPHLLEHLRMPRFKSRWFNPRSFSIVFLILLLIVLMGPSWRQQPSPLSQDDAALVILLDTSSSMTQRDVQPSRLRRAKQKVSDLLALRPDKRAALVVYSGSAHTVLTLTADREILDQYLAAIEPGIMPRSGKFPEYALPLLDDVLRQNTAPATVLMISDGVGAESEPAFQDYFSRHPHQLLLLGIGQTEPPEGIAPLERRALQNLASVSGGDYLDMTINDADIKTLNRRINSYYVVLENSALPWLDSGYPLIFPALAVFLMWFRRGWTLTMAVLIVPAMLTLGPAPVMAQDIETDADSRRATHYFADLWLTGDQQGRLLMQWGNYREAAGRFDNPLWKGMAYYYAEDFMLAAQYFSRSDTDVALFNEANARAHARDYLRAVQRYNRLLERNPQYPGAAENRDRVQSIIDDINRMSESQQEEAGTSTETKEMGGDDAIPAEGADTLDWQQAELLQLSAEDILQDPQTSEMWLRGVQQDPSDFLATKFMMQLSGATEEPTQGQQP
jgi:Ca-activated chloride channel homolog